MHCTRLNCKISPQSHRKPRGSIVPKHAAGFNRAEKRVRSPLQIIGQEDVRSDGSPVVGSAS